MLALYLTARHELCEQEVANEELAKEKQQVMNFLHNVVDALGDDNPKQEVYRRILHESILGTNALSACIYEFQEQNKLVSVSKEGLFPPLKELLSQEKSRAEFLDSAIKKEVFNLGEGIIGEVASTKRPLFINDALSNSKIIKHNDSAIKITSLIASPIVFRNNLLGVLALANSTLADGFSKNEFYLLKSFAEQSGLAIHNANLMSYQITQNKLDFDLKLASNIQNFLLSKPSKLDIKGVELAVHYEPAQQVGGDLYDIIPLNSHKFAIVIADVSGKGIAASLLMTICLTHIKHYTNLYNSPAEVLKRLNKDLLDEINKNMFVTIAYAIIDTEQNIMTLAKAGHESPIMYSNFDDNDEIKLLNPPGMAVGMFPCEIFDSVVKDEIYQLKNDTTIIFYTDGVTEALNSKNEEFSQTHLIDVINRNKAINAKDLTSTLINHIKTFSGQNNKSDDITLITIKKL